VTSTRTKAPSRRMNAQVSGLLLAFALLPLLPGMVVAQESKAKNVLLVFSHERERALYEALDDGLRSALQAGSSSAVNYFTEYLDLMRFDSEDQKIRMTSYFRAKYADLPINLIVAISPLAVDFVLERRELLFPGVPIVFTSVNLPRARELARVPNVTGIGVKHDLTATLDIALRLHPDAVSVIIPAGTSPTEKAWTGDTRRSLEPYERQVKIVLLSGLTMDELEERLRRLPEHTIVIAAGLFFHDSNGQYFSPEESLRRICQSSSAPVYGLNEPEIGSGIVGGSLYDLGAAGAAAGAVGRRILAGDLPASIPLQTLNADRSIFDARQLRRWHIDERRLPPGSVVRFLPPSLWRDYRPQVLMVAAVALAQTLLIAGLLVEHRRRRAAEIRSRHDLANIALLERRGAMGQLTGSIAHELYQPLGAILRNAEAGKMMVASSSPPTLEQLQEIFEDIRKDDKRAGAVIQRMRAFLQKHELEEKAVDVNEVATEVVALLAPDIESRGVRVDVDLAARPSIVLGDRVHLQQVVLNLMLNGMDATMSVPADRRRLFVRTRSAAGQLSVSIEDTGGGIPFDPTSQVFEPFFTTKTAGMGLGLSIARSIVEAHGGHVVAENNPREGATVRFTVPLSRYEDARAAGNTTNS
jgi:signal transduction histidine kinase